MRLLRIDENGDFSLVEREGNNIPRYAILSHTWGEDKEEVTFRDLQDDRGKTKAGYSKLRFCGKQAATDNLQYFWIDTCCIDKSSSAELTEAINSMYRWYKYAAICYVYLSDVSADEFVQNAEAFQNSRWFTRGWTLQELIAPSSVEFFSSEGRRIGDKQSLVHELQAITGIPVEALQGRPLSQFSVDERLSWAEQRQTKRDEDAAYSLLGIFDVYMPPIYGEGRENAFVRLRREIEDPQRFKLPIVSRTPVPEVLETKAAPELDRYDIPFSLKGVPVGKFAERPQDTMVLKQALLPQEDDVKRHMLVLHGLGGAGKTQLAADFARRHQHSFSCVFWLNGSSKNNFKQALATCASRIPMGQVGESSRLYASGLGDDLDAVMKDVLHWLSLPDNGRWLIIIDNVDRDYRSDDPEAYDIQEYLPEADHGSVLITTRLPHLGQLGERWEVKKVDKEQARAIFEAWYGKSVGPSGDELLELLDGLPLALAQAAAYMNELGISPNEYTRMYKERWRELMKPQDEKYMPLRSYANGTVATTWIISYTAIKERNESAANLLLLWAHLDNKSLWYELLVTASRTSTEAARLTSTWLGEIIDSEMEFIKAIGVLRSYSLVEEMEDQMGYATHPVVHQWAQTIQDDQQRASLSRLAVIIVGFSVPMRNVKNYWELQARLLPHADCCVKRIEDVIRGLSDEHGDEEQGEEILQGHQDEQHEDSMVFEAIYYLGNLFEEWIKLEEAEKMYIWALENQERLLGEEHIITLRTMNDLGSFYTDQGKTEKAEEVYLRTMECKVKAFGKDHQTTLDTVHSLANLNSIRGRTNEAEALYKQALEGFKEVLGPKHITTLSVMYNLGAHYADYGLLNEAETMYEQALEGRMATYGLYHRSTLNSILSLANLYRLTGRLEKAEPMYTQVLHGFKTILGENHTSTLMAIHNLGALHADQGNLDDAGTMYRQALSGYELAVGSANISTFPPALAVMTDIATLCASQNQMAEAKEYYSRALSGYEQMSAGEHPRCQTLREWLASLDNTESSRRRLVRAPPKQSSLSDAVVRQKPSTSKFGRLRTRLGWKR